MNVTLTPKAHAFIVILAIMLAYIVLHFQIFREYSLQIFALTIFIFFVIKRMKGAKIWHVLPDRLSVEVGLLTFATLFLIGATGNMHSMFFPLSYIHLFFLIFSTTPRSALIALIGVILFHVGVEVEIGGVEIGLLLSLPTIGLLLVFAKKQYDEVHIKEELLEAEVKELDKTSRKEHALESFVRNFLRPKLARLTKLLDDPQESNEQVSKQLSLIETELDKIVSRVTAEDAATPAPDQENTK